MLLPASPGSSQQCSQGTGIGAVSSLLPARLLHGHPAIPAWQSSSNARCSIHQLFWKTAKVL